MAGMQSSGGNAIGTGNMRLTDEYFSSALIGYSLGLPFISVVKGGSTTGAIRASHMLRTWTLNILLTYYFGKEAVSALSVQSSVTSLFLCIAVGPLVGLNTDNSSIAGLTERGR